MSDDKSSDDKSSETVDLIIKFHNEAALKAFALWLCESGEQGYWEFAGELPNPKEKTVIFLYHGEDGKQSFMPDNVIRTRKAK